MTDCPINPKFPLLTRANAGEVLPDPCSPLGWTLVMEPGALRGFGDAAELDYAAMDLGEFDPHRPELVGSLGGYFYINASSARIFGARGPGMTPEAIDAAYFGEHPDVPPYAPEPWHENPVATERIGAFLGAVLTVDDLAELREDRDLADSIRASRPDLGAVTDEALVERTRSLIPTIRHLSRRNMTLAIAASVGPGMLTAIATGLGDPAIALALITAVGDIDSAAPSLALWELSRLAADSKKNRRFQSSSLFFFCTFTFRSVVNIVWILLTRCPLTGSIPQTRSGRFFSSSSSFMLQR